ncbi:hypothetical protein LQ327_01185 [Actinomycetospora endophytica]|uniref:Uncharacterized protein n=1 Tax=Actinomycetospora endophytica TaxID=2291215 RepID=A0ABS8P1N9_9PSEU|nr:hypothetical protein [Actinomycetospora endophytica]MCD2192004.1 hypothetical protein [Actinomycetospora endophytica]
MTSDARMVHDSGPRRLSVRVPQAALAGKREYWEWRRPDTRAPTEPPSRSGYADSLRGSVPPAGPPFDDGGGGAPRDGGAVDLEALLALTALPGGEALCVVDDAGRRLAETGDVGDASALLEWVRHLGTVAGARGEALDDVVVVASPAYHLLRRVTSDGGSPIWVYLRLRRPGGNLAMARNHLADLARRGRRRALPASPTPTGPRGMPKLPARVRLPATAHAVPAPTPDIDPAGPLEETTHVLLTRCLGALRNLVLGPQVGPTPPRGGHAEDPSPTTGPVRTTYHRENHG